MKKLIGITTAACKKEEVKSNNNSGYSSQVSLSDKIIGHWQSNPFQSDYNFTLKFCII